MQKALIGRKIGMSQIFDDAGKAIPVTVIQAGPCTVVQKKTEEKDGYVAVQLGFDEVPDRKLTKPEVGHCAKAGKTLRVLKEFKLDNAEELNVGDTLDATVFAEGDHVDITGISKGKGYQGSVKRCGTHIQKKTHGGGPVHRHAGSMNAATDPSRIFKGKNGAGQMGNEQVTVINLDVVKVDDELGLIAVRGAVPGPRGGIVAVHTSVKKIVEKKSGAGISVNPQKASARVNPQKASARTK